MIRLSQALLILLLPVLIFGTLTETVSFADALYREGEYADAIREYRHFLFTEASDREDSTYAVLQIIRCRYQATDFQGMIDTANKYPALLAKDETFSRIKALANLRLGYHRSAVHNTEKGSLPETMAYECLARLMLEENAEAQQCLQAVKPYYSIDAESLYHRLAKVQDELKAADRFSPLAAGILAVIPGAGYAYTGRYQTALASLVVNSALMLSTLELYRQDLKWTSGLVLSVAMGFYLGYIYGSASAAAKDNQKERETYLRKFLEKSPELMP